MRNETGAPGGKSPTCLEGDAPRPSEASAAPGPMCAGREVYCTPSCGAPLRGSLKEFWQDWEKGQADEVPNLGIECPCGQGG